ncbi:regulatory protein TetR [Brenneria sp. EniD312]|uniref:TetR/AcrR family transcriptional regulator n=1 Tax=Brenneria sp. EniD312 TaxID=598467 RepID=UPI00022F7B0E|nr:TetR/AcrR family transcriptional regulator [Brenneria sp. EniD312]EHD22121.1 regulatory protein TetR [Brenneria sp. EniD312]
MARRTRAEMEETRATLMVTARQMFAAMGYADTSMDDLTARAGLTRGALYHHFGDKKGLLLAVVEQIDTEMDIRLQEISDVAEDVWEGLRNRCRAYLKMAQEPEIQRIVLRDARAVLGTPPIEAQQRCIESMQTILQELIRRGVVVHTDSEALAVLICGSLAEASFWIAESDECHERLEKALATLDILLSGVKA